jgi:hypothetical protein
MGNDNSTEGLNPAGGAHFPRLALHPERGLGTVLIHTLPGHEGSSGSLKSCTPPLFP